MAGSKITLYLDVISPFAYVAYHVLRTSSAFAQCDIKYVPILLGGVMNATGNRPPIEIKNKDKWVALDRDRWMKYFNVPVASSTPTPFPQPTINAQRALCYVQATHPEKLTKAFDALYKCFWVDLKTVNDPKEISAALEKTFDKDFASEVVGGIKSDAAKNTLRQNTDKALEDEAFGLPYFVATNSKGQTEKYWGVDHMGMMIDHLGLQMKRVDGGFKALL